MASTVHVVYGSFKPSTDILGQVYTFYVEDIIFTETDTKIDFIIERMMHVSDEFKVMVCKNCGFRHRKPC